MVRTRETQGGWRPSPKLIIGLCLAVWALTVALAVYLMAFRSFTTSWGETIKRNERYVWIDNQTLTQSDLEQIARIGTLKSLVIRDCNVAECRLPELRFASKNLYSVSFSGTKGLWDLSFLSEVPSESLDLSDCPGVSDISTLNWDVLEDLIIDGTDVTDLSPVAGTQLRQLSFAHTEVSDLTPLAEASELWEVDGSYSKVASLDALAGLERLWEICFDGCPLREVSKPFATPRLYRVSLCDTQVRDLSGLAGKTDLRTLRLGGCRRVRDLSWLSPANYETLIELDLGGTKLGAQDVSWVSQCTNLEELTLDGIGLGNLGFCRKLPLLKALSCVNCGITDISGIKGCTELEMILLGYNRVEGIEGLPAPHAEWPTMLLDLSHNGLASARDLRAGEYRTIFLHGNDPDIGRTVPSGVSAYCVTAPWFRGYEDSRLGNRDMFDYLFFLDCPEDEVERMQNAFLSWRVNPVTEDELLQRIEENDLYYSLSFETKRYADYVRSIRDEASEAE